MTLRPLFVTQIYEDTLAVAPGFEAFNAELAEACRSLAVEDHAGRAWCRAHAYRGYTSYGSLNDLPNRMPEFAELKRRLDRHALAYAQALNLDLARKPGSTTCGSTSSSPAVATRAISTPTPSCPAPSMSRCPTGPRPSSLRIRACR